ncbi:uncharacterized protein LOC124664358 [Lolium rigidum]|uniref:uncharacterized protein LOC124664358 n=1 Tax=Lolium rigidum TaxID=89674 RepID=UPI001F5D8CC6|nr:uncharacterized protein LOC124664358 [Lolium rigidum]
MVSEDVKLLELIFDGSIKPTDLKFSALESITQNFAEERIIGEGGFATVYKGILRNGEVAVKRINNKHTINEKLFHREVNSLLNVSHTNIVRFLGFCSHTNHKAFDPEGLGEYILAEYRERILCFEYINNGSLRKYIADELRGLPWDTRVLVIKGICEGLQYLHVKKHIIHRDLKPENILIDISMVAKITDFGLSRMEKNAQTKSKTRMASLGYTAPEYIEKGEMSFKYDVYSLGIIIIELVTGSRNIPDSNTVLRRWKHRLRKSGKETPFVYQQIAKLIEIGLLCQEKDPYKRPSISDIRLDINELESTDKQISNANESTAEQHPYMEKEHMIVSSFHLNENISFEDCRRSKHLVASMHLDLFLQISPYLEDDMLGIEPLELCFPFEVNVNNQISSSIELTNKTNAFIAFIIQTTSPLQYFIQPKKDIVAPRSKYSVNITLQSLDKAPQDRGCIGDFIVRSTKVNESLISEDITDDTFRREEGKLVDEVNLTIKYKAEVPQVDVRPTEAESKISASTSDEVIRFDPPELCFPIVPDRTVLSSIKIINTTESYVSFSICYLPGEKPAGLYHFNKSESVLPPRSTECLAVRRYEKEGAVENMELNEEFNVGYAIVAEGIKACDLDANDYTQWKKLHIVGKKINSCTSNELIQFEPPELSFPCLNKTSLSWVNIVNNTDCHIGYSTWKYKTNVASYAIEQKRGILPPRSTQRMVVQRVPKEKKEEEESESSSEEVFVWNMIVSEGVEASSLTDYYRKGESKELPLVFSRKIINPWTSDELIRLDHPELRFTFSQNKTALSSINMVNVTDYYVGFRLFNGDTNALYYEPNPELGVLAPRSAQRVLVSRPIDQKEPEEDMQYNDEFFMWNAIVSEGVRASDLDCYMCKEEEQSNELPIILNKVTSSTSVELIKLEPPEVCFTLLPSKHLLSSIMIVNITDYHIGFNTAAEETTVASYITEPKCGVLRPWSTQELVVSRVSKDETPELVDMQCADKYFVWSGFVTEDVNANDLITWMPITERKEFPIVFAKESSNELIQFDPPELCLPLLLNQRVLSSAKIVNITDQYIGFRICTKKSNSARYYANPSEGILPPLSTQLLLVTRIAEEKELEDTRCTDKFLVWNVIVTEDFKASNVIDNMSETKCTELPIVLTKTSSSTSEQLIQLDPPELHLPFLPNKKVLSSIKIENLTDYNVGFNTYSRPTNAAWYHTEPPRGILPPRSTRKLMVTREEKEDALEDQHFNDMYFVWKSIVSEGVKDSDLSDYMADQESLELPIILDKANLDLLSYGYVMAGVTAP